ncbi:MAG: DNA polymerase III subunit delta' [Sulfuricurvum sp.]|uniref:DNA polymerase III subunit delta' n=1 Tax=Sulfuricurvum sp. TaxID=2025608 RepID=UPI002614F72B|nr:DNA polymerase III subunit delta' [Sulfuricurvum sp.]MDD2828545.1 DNA polymerase III subunit delta' [Sulfuricurvum sp.]MDD4948924.1 DNA polymerase III subunit delta' [Sulfuricurvum sp.]
MFTLERGGILITPNYEERALEIVQQVAPQRAISFVCDDFKIEDAKEVIAEAYKAEETTKTLILGAKSFTIPAQNALLKILEEPPRNIVFVLMAPNKSTFLPTIRSRLTLHVEKEIKEYEKLDISLRQLDLNGLFTWVKANDRLKKHEAKELIERLFHHAVYSEGLVLNTSQLEGFEKAYRLIELNSRFQSVLVMVLMNFLKEAPRGR